MILETRSCGTMCGKRLQYVPTTTTHSAITSSLNSFDGPPQNTHLPTVHLGSPKPSPVEGATVSDPLASSLKGRLRENVTRLPPPSACETFTLSLDSSKSSGTGVSTSRPFPPTPSTPSSPATTEEVEELDSIVACRRRAGLDVLPPEIPPAEGAMRRGQSWGVASRVLRAMLKHQRARMKMGLCRPESLTSQYSWMYWGER